jgi:hypothetical protein
MMKKKKKKKKIIIKENPNWEKGELLGEVVIHHLLVDE